MPTIFTSSTSERERPLMLIAGYAPYITHPFVKSITGTFRLIVLNNPHVYPQNDTLYQVHNTAADTINHLTEKIEYAVFFITEDDDKRLLENLIPKIEKDKPKTLILLPIKSIEKYSDVILALKHISSVSFGIVGEIFGKEVPAESSRSSYIIHTAITEKHANFTGDDLQSIFPISDKDVIKGIQHLLFSNNLKSRVFFLFYEHPQTIISTIHILKKIEPDIHILYNKQSESFSQLPSHKELEQLIVSKSKLNPSYLTEDLAGLEKEVSQTSFNRDKQTNKKIQIPKKEKFNLSPPKSLATIITSSLLLFLIVNVLLILGGVVLAKQSLKSLQEGDFITASRQLDHANSSLTIAEPVISTGFTLARYLRLPSINESYNTFSHGIRLSRLAAAELSKLTRIQSGLDKNDFLESLATSTYIYFSLQSSPFFTNLPHINDLTDKTNSNILVTGSVLPEVLGYSGEKKYLLLFQNSGELRPTGGFIGSVGELSINNGKITNFVIQDVYDIDGQITEHVEPPFIVRRYLQPHLYLRDSNFALDFQEAATTAAMLYKKAGNNEVDGVIAVDFEVLNKIIAEIGPLRLPSYNKTIDEKNSFDFIHNTIEDTFFPGSSQKGDILQEVFGQITLKVEDPRNTIKIAKLLPQLIAEKHVLFSFEDPYIQDIFTAQNFAGTLTQLKEVDDDVSEYFAINEANIGVNKANRHITRNVTLNQTLTKETIDSQANVTFKNTGDEDYKMFIRVIVPKNSTFNKLVIDGIEVETIEAITDSNQYESPSFKSPTEVELVENIYQDKKTFGFISTVRKESTSDITIFYNRTIEIPNSTFTYNTHYQTQPGTTGYTLTTSLNFPDNLEAIDTNIGTISKNKVVVQLPEVKTDQQFTTQFRKR